MKKLTSADTTREAHQNSERVEEAYLLFDFWLDSSALEVWAEDGAAAQLFW